jgi:predicted nucleic acid-binding protein
MRQSDGLLDTSFIVRYLTGQPSDRVGQARAVIESDRYLALTDVGIVEAAYVLTTIYRIPRERTVDSLVALIQRRNIVTPGTKKEYVVTGLLMCRSSNRVSFGDALIWAAARSQRVPAVYTFDERFPSDGIRLLPQSPTGQ